MKTKNLLLAVSLVMLSTILISTITSAQGTWTQMADFPGAARYSAATFSIGTKGYISVAYSAGDFNLNDLWEWDQATNVWNQRTNFGGIARYGAVGFAIGDKGYIGTGGDGGFYSTYQDFWEYKPSITTGIEGLNKENILFYPNPASDIITLNTNHPVNKDMTINIYKISGELINSESLLYSRQKINIGELSNGVYFIEIKSKEGSERQKLIVQRAK